MSELPGFHLVIDRHRTDKAEHNDNYPKASALAKLEKTPKMKAVWKQGSISRDWSTAYRGLTFRIKVDPETAKATEISWYISGKVEMISPVRVTVDVAKRIATKVIDHQIGSEAKWQAAETRYQRGLFLRR